MDIITLLKTRSIPLTKLLPDGGLNRLAKKHNLNSKTVSCMLRGTRSDYRKQTIMAVLESAIQEIKNDTLARQQEVAKIEEKIGQMVAA